MYVDEVETNGASCKNGCLVMLGSEGSSLKENHQRTSRTIASAMAAAAICPMRLAALTQARCSIFQTAYNPTSARTGAKYLRARLRGPSMIKYYPPEANIAQIIKQWPELEMRNYAEEERLREVEDKKKRGKGAPKKAKEKGELKPHSAFRTTNPSFQATVAELEGSGNGRLWLLSYFCEYLLYHVRPITARIKHYIHLHSACSFHARNIVYRTVICTHLR